MQELKALVEKAESVKRELGESQVHCEALESELKALRDNARERSKQADRATALLRQKSEG